MPVSLAARFEKYLELASIDEAEYAEKWGEAHHMAAEDRRIEEEKQARLEMELSGAATPRKQPTRTQKQTVTMNKTKARRYQILPGHPPCRKSNWCRSKRDAHDQVISECTDDVLFPMFLVRTSETKQQIARTCTTLIKVVLKECAHQF